MAEPVEIIADRFDVLAQAAKGGMGTIYQARDRKTGALVAVKLMHAIDPDSVARFEREATILAGLEHPRIVRYVAHGSTGSGKPYLAMEWVEGETLQARTERDALTIGETVDLGQCVADALAYAHARGIVHRDIKPTNLMLRGNDLAGVAILDFGVARGSVPGGLTSTGALVGTPAYMSPEQAQGVRDLDPAVDVFALGCVLYECLTGRRAFEGKHTLALVAKIVFWDPPRVRAIDPEISIELDTVIAAMIAKDRRARPRDGAAVAALLASVPVSTPRPRKDRLPPATAALVRATAPTITTHRGGKLASIVVATPPDAAESELPADAPAFENGELAAALALMGVRYEMLRDGSVLAAVTGEVKPVELVDRAVACARAIRRLVPQALIAIATGEIGEGDELPAIVASLLEETVAALAKEAMVALFAGAGRPPGAIRVDSRTASLLTETIVRVKSTSYVYGGP